MALKTPESCKHKFKELRILTVISLYVLEVLCYTKKHRGSILQNSLIHEHNTRRKNDLHVQPCRISSFQKSVINKIIKVKNNCSCYVHCTYIFLSCTENTLPYFTVTKAHFWPTDYIVDSS